MHGAVDPFSQAPHGLTLSIGDALAWLDRHINLEAIESGKAGRHALPTLDRIAALTRALGDPEESFPVIHVTGTNGKGSTSQMAASLLMALGLNPGVYSSPNLQMINERMSVGGRMISDDELAAQLSVMAQFERFTGVQATWFELITATAFRWFADEAVDAGVVEVGLGGRFDATNVADAAVSVVTNVELDHVDILGHSREQIAAEKAGIIKNASWVVIGETDPVIAEIFVAEAEKVGAAGVWHRGPDFGTFGSRLAVGGRAVDLYTPAGEYEDIFIPLHGAHQADNAAAAIAAVQAFVGAPLEQSVVEEAFAAVRVPGRLETIPHRPLIILDGAHNVAGAAAAGTALSEDFRAGQDRKLVVVMGCLRGRDPREMLSAFGAENLSHVVACTAPSPRALPGEVVARAATDLAIETSLAESVGEAIDHACEVAGEAGIVVVTGSLYVVGEARSVLGR